MCFADKLTKNPPPHPRAHPRCVSFSGWFMNSSVLLLVSTDIFWLVSLQDQQVVERLPWNWWLSHREEVLQGEVACDLISPSGYWSTVLPLGPGTLFSLWVLQHWFLPLGTGIQFSLWVWVLEHCSPSGYGNTDFFLWLLEHWVHWVLPLGIGTLFSLWVLEHCSPSGYWNTDFFLWVLEHSSPSRCRNTVFHLGTGTLLPLGTGTLFSLWVLEYWAGVMTCTLCCL